MNFPFEVTKASQIKIGDRIEVTWTKSGDVIVGSVQDTEQCLHPNGHPYTKVKVRFAYTCRWVDVDNEMLRLGFSIRILSRPKPEPVRPPVGTIVRNRDDVPSNAFVVMVREGIDMLYGYQIIGYKED